MSDFAEQFEQLRTEMRGRNRRLLQYFKGHRSEVKAGFEQIQRELGRIVAASDQLEARLEEHIENTDTELEAIGGILRSGMARMESTLADHEDRLSRLEESA